MQLLLGGVLSDEGAVRERWQSISRSPNKTKIRIHLLVLGNGLLLGQSPPLAQAPEVPLPLQPHRSDETLNLGSLGVWLGTLLLRDDFTPDDKLPNVILLAQVEESPDLGGTLGTETLGENVIGETWDLLFTLLDDDDGENGDIGVDDATTDGLALTFTGSTSSVARVTVSQEETGSLGEENTLLHWETLLVVTTGDAENVTLPLGTQGLSGNAGERNGQRIRCKRWGDTVHNEEEKPRTRFPSSSRRMDAMLARPRSRKSFAEQ